MLRNSFKEYERTYSQQIQIQTASSQTQLLQQSTEDLKTAAQAQSQPSAELVYSRSVLERPLALLATAPMGAGDTMLSFDALLPSNLKLELDDVVLIGTTYVRVKVVGLGPPAKLIVYGTVHVPVGSELTTVYRQTVLGNELLTECTGAFQEADGRPPTLPLFLPKASPTVPSQLIIVNLVRDESDTGLSGILIITTGSDSIDGVQTSYLLPSVRANSIPYKLTLTCNRRDTYYIS
jgi:hypothetical protein